MVCWNFAPTSNIHLFFDFFLHKCNQTESIICHLSLSKMSLSTCQNYFSLFLGDEKFVRITLMWRCAYDSEQLVGANPAIKVWFAWTKSVIGLSQGTAQSCGLGHLGLHDDHFSCDRFVSWSSCPQVPWCCSGTRWLLWWKLIEE